ncbi:glycosyltransferase [bacterium]|nr:glycosyltransferase [bacterium]
MAKFLYISHDGLLEPLGQSQVLGYLEKLSNSHKIFIISYEKEKDMLHVDKVNFLKKNLNKKDIHWFPLKYHKKPAVIATLFDIAIGLFFSLYIALRYHIKIVHARSYTASVIALVLKKIINMRYIFDMRGFWVDERVDGGMWKKSDYIFRISKWFEKSFLVNADVVVSLTKNAVDEMKMFPYLENRDIKFKVITTCTNLQVFKPDLTIKQKQPFVLGYVGSVGVWYMFDEALYCFKLIQEIMPNARMHIINKGGHDFIYSRLNILGIDLKYVLVEELDRDGVVESMRVMNAGIFFYRQAYSKKATAPTKLGEFLASGIPCLTNKGVGDTSEILEKTKCGIVLSNFSKEEMERGVILLLSLTEDSCILDRCRSAALDYFSLDDGVKSYNEIYETLGRDKD